MSHVYPNMFRVSTPPGAQSILSVHGRAMSEAVVLEPGKLLEPMHWSVAPEPWPKGQSPLESTEVWVSLAPLHDSMVSPKRASLCYQSHWAIGSSFARHRAPPSHMAGNWWHVTLVQTNALAVSLSGLGVGGTRRSACWCLLGLLVGKSTEIGTQENVPANSSAEQELVASPYGQLLTDAWQHTVSK